MLILGTIPIPEASEKVCRDDSNDNQSENLVDIQNHVLSDNLFISRGVATHKRFGQFFES